MADIKGLVARIRRRVHDSDLIAADRPLYAQVFYTDAIDRGLAELNLDLGEAYTVATVPGNREFLLELRGTIEMCYIRGAEGGSSDVADTPESPIQTLSVPGLSVNRMATPPKGPKAWEDLCARLEAQYRRLIDKIEDDEDVPSTTVTQSIMTRKSMRTGMRRQYVYDTAFDALAPAIAVVGSTVTVTWSQVSDERFGRYEVYRDAAVDMAAAEKVGLLPDNHDIEFEDEPGTGTWYYRVDVFNDNNLGAESSVLSAVVP